MKIPNLFHRKIWNFFYPKNQKNQLHQPNQCPIEFKNGTLNSTSIHQKPNSRLYKNPPFGYHQALLANKKGRW